MLTAEQLANEYWDQYLEDRDVSTIDAYQMFLDRLKKLKIQFGLKGYFFTKEVR